MQCAACVLTSPEDTSWEPLVSLRNPAPAPQVVPVCTRLMTSTPPVCICGCKNSKVVTQSEKCFPSGYVVFSILTTTPQSGRMHVEEEEVVLEVLCKTSFDWQHSVTVPKTSQIHLSFGKSPPQPAASPRRDTETLYTNNKSSTWHTPPCGTRAQDKCSSRLASQQMDVAQWWLQQPSESFWPWWPGLDHVSLIFWAAADF